MTRVRAGLLLGLLAAASARLPAPAAAADPAAKPSPNPGGRQQPAKMEREVKVTVKTGYLLYLPKDYDKDPARKWPVIVFLHGSGERGTDLNLVKLHGPPKVVEQGMDLPFVIVSPQCAPEKWWDPQAVVALLDEVIEKHRVDPDRAYLTGLSMGGFGTWDTAIAYPDRFAAIAPICGGGNPYRAAALKNVPTWVFHGEKDPAVPVAASAQMVGVLKQVGGDVKFTRYPDAGHDSWTQTYAHRALYDWFLQHRRGQQPEAGAGK